MILSLTQVSEAWCLLCTVFCGLSWVGSKEAMNIGVGPLTFNALRFVGSALYLCFTRPLLQRVVHCDVNEGFAPPSEILLVIQSKCKLSDILTVKQFEMAFFGLLVGVTGFAGLCLQQVALVHITATMGGFITSLFVIATPVFEFLLQPVIGIESQLSAKTWVAAVVSLVGMYLLTGGTISGDKADDILDLSNQTYGMIVMFVSMLFITLEIIACDAACKRVDCIDLTVVMFIIIAVCSVITAMIVEPDQWFTYPMFSSMSNSDNAWKAWGMVLLVSVAEGSGYTTAALGQMYTNPSRAALIFTMEGVLTAIMSFLLLNEKLDLTETFGCVLVFAATFFTASTTSDVHVEVVKKRTPSEDSILEKRVVSESTPLITV